MRQNGEGKERRLASVAQVLMNSSTLVLRGSRMNAFWRIVSSSSVGNGNNGRADRTVSDKGLRRSTHAGSKSVSGSICADIAVFYGIKLMNEGWSCCERSENCSMRNILRVQSTDIVDCSKGKGPPQFQKSWKSDDRFRTCRKRPIPSLSRF